MLQARKTAPGQPQPSSRPCEAGTKPTECSFDGHTLFLAHYGQIRSIINSVSQRFRIDRSDAEDFSSIVTLRLIDDDYRILKQFRGDSSWRTFLTKIIRNIGCDFMNRRLGKWQASKKAGELGPAAIRLEMLRSREGYSLDEAIELLLCEGSKLSRSELHEIDKQLPCRSRRRFEGEAALETLMGHAGVEQRIEDRERLVSLERVRVALGLALRELEDREVAILQWHYGEGQALADIARVHEIPQRRAYTLRDRSLRKLKLRLQVAGVKLEDVRRVIGWSVALIEIDFEKKAVALSKSA